MALIKCKECNKKISDTAQTCPHCGFNIQKQKEEEQKKIFEKYTNGCLLIIVIFILFLLIIGLNHPTDSKYEACINTCGYLKGKGLYTSHENVKCQKKCSYELEQRRERKK